MPQPVIPAGILLGSRVYVFQGQGDPNPRHDDLLTSVSRAGVDSLSPGSLYIDRSAGTLFIKTGAVSVAAPAGVWTAK